MNVVADVLVALVTAFHVYVMVLEMFLWQKAPGRKLSGLDAELSRVTAPLAANQGLYNGFLAAGLLCGLLADAPVGFPAQVFFLVCVVFAGVFGGLTVNRRILLAQAAPGLLALAAVVLAR